MARFLSRHLEVLVVSAGGVGTTALIDFVGRHRQVNHRHNADGLKHLGAPPSSSNRAVRFIYVHGDPVEATLSLFRRRFQHNHSITLQHDLVAAIEPIGADTTLEQYAAAGRDLFLFERHFDNWYRRGHAHPTLFVSYEHLWEHGPAICAFLGLDPSAAAGFPVRRDRRSTTTGVDPLTLDRLRALYGPFSARRAGIPPLCFRPTMPRLLLPLSRNFRTAAAAHASFFAAGRLPAVHPAVRRLLWPRRSLPARVATSSGRTPPAPA